MQQLPRDNPTVKGCIKAEKDKIISMDLTTAEVYVAAVLAKDVGLQEVFKSGGNFHSTIAKQVFNLPCEVEDADKHYSDKRQQAKAVTFGIMYGAGLCENLWQVTKDSGKVQYARGTESYRRLLPIIPNLRKWLNEREAAIKANAYLFSLEGSVGFKCQV